jgi:putative DNA primase/helicase
LLDGIGRLLGYGGGAMTALDLRAIARALGGEVSGRRVLAPGPQHSPKDRSLCVSLAPALPGGFLVHSFADDDPIQCKDYVRVRLGLPAWQPGDEQDRRVHLSRIQDWDRTIADGQATLREKTEDDLIRIQRAQALWNEAADPRDTVTVQYIKARALDLPDDLAGAVLRFHPRCPWRNEDTGRAERIPALLAAFRSIDDEFDCLACNGLRLAVE